MFSFPYFPQSRWMSGEGLYLVLLGADSPLHDTFVGFGCKDGLNARIAIASVFNMLGVVPVRRTKKMCTKAGGAWPIDIVGTLHQTGCVALAMRNALTISASDHSARTRHNLAAPTYSNPHPIQAYTQARSSSPEPNAYHCKCKKLVMAVFNRPACSNRPGFHIESRWAGCSMDPNLRACPHFGCNSKPCNR